MADDRVPRLPIDVLLERAKALKEVQTRRRSLQDAMASQVAELEGLRAEEQRLLEVVTESHTALQEQDESDELLLDDEFSELPEVVRHALRETHGRPYTQQIPAILKAQPRKYWTAEDLLPLMRPPPRSLDSLKATLAYLTRKEVIQAPKMSNFQHLP